LNEHWITNVARGAKSMPCPITPEIADISLRATRAVGLDLAGVDLIETSEGMKVIEVNTGAEFKGLIQTTDVDIPGRIVDYVVNAAVQEWEKNESRPHAQALLNGI
jgi:[lysine-biosynthesis-protein LysW]--L-2-aminoadipate ligase